MRRGLRRAQAAPSLSRGGLLIALSLVLLVGCAGGPRAKYPIDDAQGRYTVVAQTFRNQVEEDGRVTQYAVAMANDWAQVLRDRGHEKVHVADLGTEAMVTMGSYPSRESARSAVRQVAKVLQELLGGQVRIRGRGRSAGGPALRMQRPYPEEIEHIKALSKRRRR